MSEGDKKNVHEYNFDEAEIDKASINMDQTLALPAPKDDVEPIESGIGKEVTLFLEHANRGPGKKRGQTGGLGRIPEISDKVRPVYFRQSIQD